MKNKIIYLFMVLLLVSCGSSTTTGLAPDSSKGISSPKITVQSILSSMEKGRYKEGEVLVKFKSGTVTSASLKTHQAIGAMPVKKIALINVDHVRLPQGISMRDAIIQYMSDPNVEYAEPNYLLHPSITPNDTYFFPQQWGLYNTGQFASGKAGADIRAPWAWDVIKSSNVIVAVVDTGIDQKHVDLLNNVIPGFNSVDDNTDTSDNIGHGTHVAGIIGALGNNGLGTSGVIWDAKLMPVKVCTAAGIAGCPDNIPVCCFTSDVADGISFAVSHGAKVINISLGSSPGAPSPSPVFDAVSMAGDAGALVVAAAGNETNNNDVSPVYPASYNLPNIISVAATDQNDKLASFSNFGLNSVHVTAPGVYILSTITPGLTFSRCTGSSFAGYDFCDGTSMAAPHVSGLAGLLFSYYPHFTYSQVRATILRYADLLPDNNVIVQTRARINAYRAVSSLQTPTNLTATAVSSGGISLTWSGNATGEDGYKIERKNGSGSFTQIATVAAIARQNVIPQPPVAYTFSDSGLTASTLYSYRVRAFNTIPADSSYSTEASATTLAPDAPPPPSSSNGGGGGCSIGARQNMPTAMADVGVLLMPLLLFAILRRRR
jgi:subtilisin family serine protease